MNPKKALALCLKALALALLVVAQGCGGAPTRTPFSFWTATPDFTQTPVIVEITTTPVFVQITTTPEPTVVQTSTKELRLCVVATEAVYLRPSPGISNYPIIHLENGVEVIGLGGRNRNWLFVSVGDSQGWVNEKYLEECES